MSALKLNLADLIFVLKQIKIAEAHADGTALTEIWVDAEGNVVPPGTPGATLAIPSPMAPFGLRTVDGTYNNIVPGRETWGAADQGMPRLLTPSYVNDGDGDSIDINGGAPGGVLSGGNYGAPGSVVDADPRTISNLIVDMSPNNPAALWAALQFAGSADPNADLATLQAAMVTQAEADAALVAAEDAELSAINGVTTAQTDLANAASAYDPLIPSTMTDLLAAVAAFTAAQQILVDATADRVAAETVAADPDAAFVALAASMGVEITPEGSVVIPNVAPDEGLSRPFNSWMTFFGQFFDHGLDLINKGSNGTVYVPLENDDPLVVGADGVFGTSDDLPENLRFMVLTRATPAVDPLTGETTQVNQTTPFVDQNQTYTSHASHQVFLREYAEVGGRPVNTGHLLDGAGNALPTWADIKEQALMLGIALEDRDVLNVPLLRTDQYGNFIPNAQGYAQVIVGVGVDGVPNTADDVVVSGTPGAPINTFTVGALRTGHAFLDDIAHNAAPQFVDPDRNPGTSNSFWQTADTDTDTGNAIVPNAFGVRETYDDELLDRHFITGDGRGNENVGLTAVHHIFHSEHNRQVEQQKLTILQSGDLDFINEWLLVPMTQGELDALLASMPTTQIDDWMAGVNLDLTWNGERLFQSARMATEMQYQHLVFEEFARVIQPNIDPFVFNSTPDINPAIFAEFANVVYRFGHSMLTENMPRIGPNGELMDDVGLIASFLNPVLFDQNGLITADAAVAATVRGMTTERGNEIDEFIVNALRDNLLGLPLDLATLNIARGRDTGMPTLNEARQQLFAASSSSFLQPYANWTDFAANLKNPISVVNFIAAYGTHTSITSVDTLAEKRDAAWQLVFGGPDVTEAERLAFLNGTDGWTAENSGLNDIDLWIGGLAEKKMPFGGMLGSTFNAIFELQLENLQDGDRFYYLTRTQGQNFLNSLEQNSFIKMIMANSDLADPGADGLRGTPDDVITRHIGVDSFGVYDFVYEVDVANQADYDPDNISLTGRDPTGADAALEAMGLGKVVRADANSIRVQGGEHVVVGGTNGDDNIQTDFGDDGIWGDAGNDRIESGAGVDLVNGGAGNDIITDSGDTGDFLKGDEGDDVIAGGNGLDILMGGTGKDVVFHGVDDTETFAGEGDDFVLGGMGVDLIMGNEGDDWLEAGDGFDTTAGDNSELFFDSKIIGHDVMFSGTEEHDFDAESGDDIMVQGESVLRNEGMFGFDWVTYKDNRNAADVDLTRGIFTTEVQDVLRNRFDKVEGVSGWDQNDFLMGDDRVYDPNATGNVGIGGEGVFFRDDIGAEGIARITGLGDVITADLMVQGQHTSEFEDIYNPTVQEAIFSHGNVILGGGGDDRIFGRGGDDIIDGDKWLNVRIRISDVGQDNEIATIDSMKHVFTADDAGDPSWVGKSLFELMVDRTIEPSQLHIVREILEGSQGPNGDTAYYWDDLSAYTITQGPNGTVIVEHTGFDPATVLAPELIALGFRGVSDGRDRLSNIENLAFWDADVGDFVSYTVESVTQVPASGAAVINDLTPIEGTALTVDTASITDPNGVGPLQFQWQRSTDGGATFANIAGATNASYTPQDLPLQAFGADAGAQLRVVVSFVDVLGNLETITSAATGPVGVNWDALVSLGATFNGLGGDDVAAGSLLADTLRGGAGADLLAGRTGDDILVGGAGNDDLRGAAGNDRAEYAGVLTNFRYTYNTATSTLTVIDTTGAEGTDTTTDVEMFRFNGSGIQNYRLVVGTNGNNPGVNGAGAANSQLVLGLDGVDTLNGGDGNDILDGGNGNDNLFGQNGNDFFLQYAGDTGFDVIAGGGGTDTYVLNGTGAAETFRIYTAAEAQAAGIAIANINSEIIITRNGTDTASKIAELRMVEEIIINTSLATANDGGGLNPGPAGGDTITVIGDFTTTSLDYSTITIAGSSANDTVDISGLTSDHRVVFTGNGGTDTLIGDVRAQDVFNGSNLNDQRVAATVAAATAATTAAFGSADGLEALTGLRGQLQDLGFLTLRGEHLGRGLGVELGRLTVDSEFELTQFALETNLNALDHAIGRTMIDTGFDQMPLDLVETIAPVRQFASAFSTFDHSFGDRRMLASDVDFLAY